MTDKEKRRPVAIDISGVVNAKVSNNTVRGSGDFLRATDIKSLEVDGNTHKASDAVAASPERVDEKWHETAWGKVAVGLIIAVIVAIVGWAANQWLGTKPQQPAPESTTNIQSSKP